MLRAHRQRAIGTPAAPVRLRSLRLRLTLLFTGAYAIGLVVLALLVITADSHFQRERLDSELRDRTHEARDSLVIDTATKSVLVSGGGAHQLGASRPWLYVFEVGPSTPATPGPVRAVLTSSATGAPHLGSVTFALSALKARHEVATNERAGARQLRLLATPFFDDAGSVRGAVVAVTDRMFPAEHGRLAVLVWAGCGLLLLTSAGIGYVLARRTTKPVGEALSQQERFLADAAHELRSPVAALRAVSDGGLAGDEEPRRALQRVRGLVDDASETLDNLLTLARMDARSQLVRIEPVRLDLLAEALLSDRQDEPPVQLRATETVVQGDAQLLRRAIDNLVDNAVRHGRAEAPAAEIEVTVRPGCVEVADRGPGLDPELLPQLFERFRSGRRSRGSGLGLGIVDWVARAHRAKVTVTNRSGGGAVFTITFPR